MTDSEYYASGGRSSASTYHTQQCQIMRRGQHLRPRSEQYIEWHDLEQCAWCASLEASDD